eukprot:TRINITY_DN28422_c0_g1_i1.p1 TRINITY_DN28422_c0_g1~~TRINITY_DN28422_c0_g1_i1.p1  ORF type:complete len:1127 (-),score=180.66 TRINITY_DN28422_c0_g1_i1:723-4103(-)
MAPASVIQLALLDAIDNNDVPGLESLLQDKARVADVLNAHIDADDGVTLLHRACKVTSPGLVSALLRAGALFDTIDQLGRSALMLALANETVDLDEQAEVVDMLLAKKANVLKSDYSARTVLHYACQGGNAECLQLLLDKGIDVDARDSQGRTPLHIAIEEGELDCAKVLISNGADKKAQDKQGLDPVHLAGSADAVNLLLGLPVPADSQVPHSKREAAKKQALHATEGSTNSASKDSKPQLVSSMPSSTADGLPSPRPSDGSTPARGSSSAELQNPRHPHRTPDQMTEVLQTQLVLAVRSQDTDKVVMLLHEHEDELDTTQSHLPEAWTPLHEAVLIQARDCVEVLLDYGFSVHAETVAGVTPLPLACSKGDYDLAILLLERGARVDATDRQGLRPLLLAASIPPGGQGGPGASAGRGTPHKTRKGHKGGHRGQSDFISRGADIVKELLNRGAQPNHTDVNQWNALHHACHSGSPEAVEYLLSRDPNTAVQRTKDGETPLHRACLSGSRECVELLLEQGTPIDAVDVDQQSPLHVAVQGGHYDCVHSLLEYAADPNIEDRESQTPLLLAVMFNHVECAKALINAGADVFCTDRRGYTLLDHAYENGSEQLFQILTRAGATSDGKLGYDEKLTKEEFVAAKMGGSARSRPPERHTVAGVDFIADTADSTSKTSKGSKSKRKPRMESQQKISSVYGSSTAYKEWHPSGPEPQTARRRPLTSARGRRARPGTAPAKSVRGAPRRRPSTGASSRRPGPGTENGAGASGNTSRPKTAVGQPSVVKRPHEFSWENFSYVRDKRENMQLQRMMETCHCSGNRWMPSVNCVCQARKEESRKLEKQVQEKADTLLAKLEKYLGPDAARRRMQSPGPKNVSREARATHRARQRRPVTASAAHDRKVPKELVASPYSGGRGVFELDDELPFMITGARGCRCGRALKFKNSTCVRCLLEDVPPMENGGSDSDSRGHSARPPPTRAEIKWTQSNKKLHRAKSARVVNGHAPRDRSQSRGREQRPLPRTKSSNTLTRSSDTPHGYPASSQRAVSPRDFDDGSPGPSHRVPRPASQQSHRPPQRPAPSRGRRPVSSTGQVRRVSSGGSVVNGVHFMPSAPSPEPPSRARHQRRPQTAGAM